MDPELGRTLVLGIAAVGGVAWLAGVAAMLGVTREARGPAPGTAERFDAEGDPAPGSVVGEAEVEGDPEELSVRLAGLLAREGMGPFGPIKILARDDRRVVFEPSGRSPVGFRGGRVRLAPSGSRTRIDYALEVGSSGPLIGGWILVGLGLVAVVVGPWLAFAYALPSPNPGTRGQALQVCQMVHFLWPPFLCAHLARMPARACRARMESLVHNLPYS